MLQGASLYINPVPYAVSMQDNFAEVEFLGERLCALEFVINTHFPPKRLHQFIVLPTVDHRLLNPYSGQYPLSIIQLFSLYRSDRYKLDSHCLYVFYLIGQLGKISVYKSLYYVNGCAIFHCVTTIIYLTSSERHIG